MPEVTDRRSFLLGKGDGKQVTFTGVLPGAPIRPGSLTVMWKARGQPHVTALDNGMGGWLDNRPGEIQFHTGELTLTWDRPPVKGVSVVVEYRVEAPADGPPLDLSKPVGPLKMKVRYEPSLPGEPDWFDRVATQAQAAVECPTCQASAGQPCSLLGAPTETHLARLQAWAARLPAQSKPTDRAWSPTHDEIVALRKKHGLSFRQNPGGGEFEHPVHGRCQVPLYDFAEDHAILLRWLRACGLEAPDTVSPPEA